MLILIGGCAFFHPGMVSRLYILPPFRLSTSICLPMHPTSALAVYMVKGGCTRGGKGSGYLLLFAMSMCGSYSPFGLPLSHGAMNGVTRRLLFSQIICPWLMCGHQALAQMR